MHFLKWRKFHHLFFSELHLLATVVFICTWIYNITSKDFNLKKQQQQQTLLMVKCFLVSGTHGICRLL